MLRSRLTVHTLDARRSLKVENNNNILAKRYAYVYVHLLMEQKSYYIDSHLFMIAQTSTAGKWQQNNGDLRSIKTIILPNIVVNNKHNCMALKSIHKARRLKRGKVKKYFEDEEEMIFDRRSC